MRRSRWAPHRAPAPRGWFGGLRWWHFVGALLMLEAAVILIAWLGAALIVR